MFKQIIIRSAYAILYGLLAFILFYALGVVVSHFDTAIGNIIETYAWLVGLLVGIITFFADIRYPIF